MSSARIPEPDGRKTDALATYGTLRPGESNYWVVAKIDGVWRQGTVRGWTFVIGWGDAEGYPGFIPDRGGQDVAVSVLLSDDLERNWRAIDDFEGEGYRRERITVTLDDTSAIEAWIYVAVTDNDDTTPGADRRRK